MRVDPLAQINLEVDDYYWITHEVIKNINWPQRKVISFLEGGYHLEFLGAAVMRHLQGLIA